MTRSVRDYVTWLLSGPMARVTRLFGWNMLATLADRGLPIIGFMIVARMLGPKDFGALGMAQNTANLAQVLILAGMGTVAVRFVAARRNDPAGIASVISMLSRCLLATSVIGFAVAALYAGQISKIVYGSAAHAYDVRLVAIYFTVLAWNGFQSSLLLGFEAMKSLLVTNLVGGVLGLGGLVVGGATMGVHGALWGLIIARGARCLMTSVLLARRPSAFRFAWTAPVRAGDWALLSAFGAASFIQSAVYNGAVWGSQVTLIQLNPHGLEQMGLFHAANQFSSLMLLFQTILTRVLMPHIGERTSDGAVNEVRRVVLSSAALAFVGTLAMAGVVSVLSPLIMAAAGAGFADHWPLLILLAGVTCVSSVVAVLEAYLLGSGKAWSVLAATIPGMVLMLGVVVAFAERGAYAVGWGMAAALVLRLAVLVVVSARRMSAATPALPEPD